MRANGHWFVETPEGRARVTFAPANGYGVLDHEVLTLVGSDLARLKAVLENPGP